MCDHAPNSIGLTVDAYDSDCDLRTDRRTAASGILTKAIDATVHCDKDTVLIHHTDFANIVVAFDIFPERFFIRVFLRSLNGCRNFDFLTVAAVNTRNPYDYTLTRLIIIACISPSLITEFSHGDETFCAEQLYENTRFDDRNDSGFSEYAVV